MMLSVSSVFLPRRSEASALPCKWRCEMTAIKIEGAKVLIVGGSSGMGLALARRLLDEGAFVTIAGRSQERLAAACRQLDDDPKLGIYAVDISREEEVAALFRIVGSVDHIVSTAADI